GFWDLGENLCQGATGSARAWEREPIPVLHHPPSEIVFHNIQLKPPPLQLETIAPCSLKAAIKSPLPLLFCSWRPGLGGCLGLALTACLLCADPSLPRPSISLSPTGVTAPGADVTIQCQGQRRDTRFFLHKTGDLNPQRHMDPAGARAEFRIPSVSRQHGGSYSCSYRPRSEPFVSSQPSDTVELVVAGEGPSSVSPLPAPPSEGQHPDGMLRAKIPVLRVPLPLSVLLRTRVGVLGLLPSCSPGGQSSRTLVLFPQRELTQPSLERRRLPPARAARGQVLGPGGIY
uniref:Ig-like domain-containing protein n=1 Tax=Terrapene triunguis TaxID=2587831 RepID=A0A674K0U7_9SAUR